MKNIFNSRRFKHGSLATLTTVIVLAVIVIINVVATMVLDRFPLNIDLTKDNRFELTQESVDFVKGIDEEIKITVCVDELTFKGAGEIYKQAYEIITGYEKHNKNIKVSFVDLAKEPTFAQKYSTLQLNVADIIVESGLRVKKVGLDELVKTSQDQSGQAIYSSQAEQAMTSALMYATDKNPITATVLTGTDNADISGYTNLLQKNNYQINTQNLLTEDIDQTTALVVMGAPSADLSVEQVKKLETYLDNDGQFGKSMVYIASKDYPIGPITAEFLANWGMMVDSGVLFETNSQMAIGNNFTMVNQIVDPDTLSALKTDTLPVVNRYSNPIITLFEESDNRKTTVIAATSDTNLIVPIDAPEDFDLAAQKQGVYNTIVKGEKNRFEGITKHTSSVLVVGSDAMLGETFLQNAGFNNGDLMITLTNAMTKKTGGVRIIPVEFANEIFTVTQAQSGLITIAFMIILPIAVLLLGLIVFLRRRHL